MTIWVPKKRENDSEIFFKAYYPTLVVMVIIICGVIISNKSDSAISLISIVALLASPMWVWIMLCYIFKLACGRDIDLGSDW